MYTFPAEYTVQSTDCGLITNSVLPVTWISTIPNLLLGARRIPGDSPVRKLCTTSNIWDNTWELHSVLRIFLPYSTNHNSEKGIY